MLELMWYWLFGKTCPGCGLPISKSESSCLPCWEDMYPRAAWGDDYCSTPAVREFTCAEKMFLRVINM
jgi:predicted amidophosphoribosyltransferase